jgi:hypothetical protein
VSCRDIEKSYVNALMLECKNKVSPASAFLLVVSCLSPALAFCHPALPSYEAILTSFLMCIPLVGLFRHLLVSVNLLRIDQGYSKPDIFLP